MAGSANLNVMMKTARKAGRGLLKDFGEVENLQVSTKGPGDFVSRADKAAEAMIKEELMHARPSYGFLGEEGQEIEGEDPTRRWIVDPLDGTTNFLHGLPHWAVSIALEHKGQIVAGVVYDPTKDEMFYAEKGGGAWLNESRLRVSGRHRMIESIFATGLPFAGRADCPKRCKTLPAFYLLVLVYAVSALLRLIWPMSLLAAMKGSGNADCILGTLPQVSSLCVRRAALLSHSALLATSCPMVR